jgi:hypothetical protein
VGEGGSSTSVSAASGSESRKRGIGPPPPQSASAAEAGISGVPNSTSAQNEEGDSNRFKSKGRGLWGL